MKNKQANREWVVSKLEAKLRIQPTLKCVEALDYFKQEFGVHIEVTKMWRAMKEAKQLVEGSERKQYAKVLDYAHELLRSNPGSTVKINTMPSPEGPPQFQRLYICIAGCKKGFVAGCRPFIGLDGCFLNSAFGENLLSTVRVDGNNHIFVIAYVVVDMENKDNWKWFLTLLHEYLRDYGLIPTLQEVMPGTPPHRFCALHLWKIFTKQWKSKELKGIVWKCAKSTTVAEFEEEIRCYIMRTMAAHKIKLSGKLGPLCPIQYKRLEKEIHFANQWTPIWCGNNMDVRYEVHMWGKKVQRGRPKKDRRRDANEDNVIGHRIKRKLSDFTCERCDQTNHNIRSCKNIGVPIRPKKYVAPPTSNQDDDLLAQDEQALNKAEEAAAHFQEGSVEINLSQPNLSQDSDMEFMVPATIVPPIARNKLNITRPKQRKAIDKDAV
ncbi:hypothetical protein GmHk_06G016598 [Glycine max]|nr:hypothetical protein GmHk_06G016598 [Glycine max]